MDKLEDKYKREIAKEIFNTIRTNINFLAMDKEMKVLMITSAVKDEGKTTVSCNIANSFASVKKKALLIDCDLRSPKVYKELNVIKPLGLPELIMAEHGEDKDYKDYIVKINDYFDVITAGRRPPNPAELLASQRLDLLIQNFKKQYDVILLDTPPILLVADAISLNRLVDGVLLVIKYGYTTKDALRESKRVFEVAGIRPSACIFNAVPNMRKKNQYYGYYGYLEDNERKRGPVKAKANSRQKEIPVDNFVNYYRRKIK